MLRSIEIIQYIPNNTRDSSKQDQHRETETLYIADYRKYRFQFEFFKMILGQLSNEGINKNEDTSIAVIAIRILKRFLYYILL